MSLWQYKQKAQPPAQPEVSVDSQRAAQGEPGEVRPADDPAESILRQAPELTDQMRETLWEVFHSKATPEELAKALQHFSASNDTKHKLWTAKTLTAPAVDHVARARAAIESVGKMDSATLEAAEKHPTVLKMIANAVLPSKSKE
jgi:hypothetical protein